ncbi:MAG TPA: hypothetical protein VGR35_10940 [Tepidisphaeraceae bacterium]|nr:hypothetical protein [Tepidisphaeraceae bacterium]
MKKLGGVIMLTLAINFLAAAGGIAYLFQTGQLDREKVRAIKALVLAPPPVDPATTQPSPHDAPTTRPAANLDELLAKASGRTAGEQVEFIQRSFDAQMALLDRRQRELTDLQRQVDLAKQQMERDRIALEKSRTELAAQQQLATKLATDKGFQDSLQLYNTMSAKQVKRVFMALDDETMRQYLQAMQPRKAAAIIKEFKTLDEVSRIQNVMEAMRTSEQTATNE